MKYQFEWKPNINFPQFEELDRCFLCPCYNGEFSVCKVVKREFTIEEELEGFRPKWCPLEEAK